MTEQEIRKLRAGDRIRVHLVLWRGKREQWRRAVVDGFPFVLESGNGTLVWFRYPAGANDRLGRRHVALVPGDRIVRDEGRKVSK